MYFLSINIPLPIYFGELKNIHLKLSIEYFSVSDNTQVCIESPLSMNTWVPSSLRAPWGRPVFYRAFS